MPSQDEELLGRRTVEQIIGLLRAYPPDMLVVVDGYEGGYDNPTVRPGLVKLAEGFGGSYCGVHSDAYPDELEGVTKVCIISRVDE